MILLRALMALQWPRLLAVTVPTALIVQPSEALQPPDPLPCPGFPLLGSVLQDSLVTTACQAHLPWDRFSSAGAAASPPVPAGGQPSLWPCPWGLGQFPWNRLPRTLSFCQSIPKMNLISFSFAQPCWL